MTLDKVGADRFGSYLLWPFHCPAEQAKHEGDRGGDEENGHGGGGKEAGRIWGVHVGWRLRARGRAAKAVVHGLLASDGFAGG